MIIHLSWPLVATISNHQWIWIYFNAQTLNKSGLELHPKWRFCNGKLWTSYHMAQNRIVADVYYSQKWNIILHYSTFHIRDFSSHIYFIVHFVAFCFAGTAVYWRHSFVKTNPQSHNYSQHQFNSFSAAKRSEMVCAMTRWCKPRTEHYSFGK